ncbi:hypothetical protein FOCC_FOCC012982 [Frankliniella occidentalis]|nr:hypothetical protein FOCC_FOCC012982 [Frankliniella occidentalis]
MNEELTTCWALVWQQETSHGPVPVVDHLTKFSEGFATELGNPAEEVLIKVFMIGICVDSGARGAVQGINSYSGYYSCNWCEIQVTI